MALATSAPVLSTSDDHLFSDIEVNVKNQEHSRVALSEAELRSRYEIDKTVQKIKENGWRRIALQFPDEMLKHSSQIYQLLMHDITTSQNVSNEALEEKVVAGDGASNSRPSIPAARTVKMTILADTSYGSCCVDEIAAEHVDADAIVHYGRACLSPTTRLPVLHIYTREDMDIEGAVEAFTSAYPDLDRKVILTGDMPFAHHVEPVLAHLLAKGYSHVHQSEIVHDPSSLIPNRRVPSEICNDPAKLSEWHLFHLAEPPTSLLLTVASKVSSIRIYDHEAATSSLESTTSMLLRRRYALVTSMGKVSTWGILINTLSVKSYMHIVSSLQQQLTNAGKKYYLFVVGKLNPAKIANFADIEGWVVVGCWESSLIDSRDFYRPILTPYELSLALQDDNERVWTGEWRADFENLLNMPIQARRGSNESTTEDRDMASSGDDESLPPDFDLRTGKYVARSKRPHMSSYKMKTYSAESAASVADKALAVRAKGDIVTINGVASPAAEFLNAKRSWKGLGSDFDIRYEDEEVEGTAIEQGRSGIAGGYSVGDSAKI